MTPSSSPFDQDRYIPGIYNYCDSWCSACSLATRCRIKSQLDVEQPPDTPGAFAAQLHNWFQQALYAAETQARELGLDLDHLQPPGEAEDPPPMVSIDHARLVSRAKAYGNAVFSWQRQRPPDPGRRTSLDPTFPQDVIDHFAFMIGSKVQRAVSGMDVECDQDGDDAGWPCDSDGSAKVAILAAERSRAAWLDLRDSGLVGNDAVDGFAERLAWLIDELERLFPRARNFVRPGFDSS